MCMYIGGVSECMCVCECVCVYLRVCVFVCERAYKSVLSCMLTSRRSLKDKAP